MNEHFAITKVSQKKSFMWQKEIKSERHRIADDR